MFKFYLAFHFSPQVWSIIQLFEHVSAFLLTRFLWTDIPQARMQEETNILFNFLSSGKQQSPSGKEWP